KEIRTRRKHIYFHTDAVQTVGKVPVNVKSLGVDLLSLSGHKIHAPKGIGALYIRKTIRIGSQLTGGHHERDRRAGTENVTAMVALGRAAELAKLHLESQYEHTKALRDYLEQEIARRIADVRFNGDPEHRLP